MKREALVPVDEEIVTGIGRQRQRNAARWTGGSSVLFPRPTKNIAGTVPANGDAYRGGLRRWLASAARTAPRSGSPRISSATRWGTTLMNRDVRQHVVQKILDHESREMTAH